MSATTIKLTVSDEMLDQLNSIAATQNITRAELIRQSISQSLHPFKRENYPKTCTEVLRATNGKLSRLESEHLVSVVIKEMGA